MGTNPCLRLHDSLFHQLRQSYSVVLGKYGSNVDKENNLSYTAKSYDHKQITQEYMSPWQRTNYQAVMQQQNPKMNAFSHEQPMQLILSTIRNNDHTLESTN